MTSTPSPALRLEGATVRYGETEALSGADLEVRPGEVHVLLGASGSGKTTMLRAIAGFERLSAGRITLGDRVLDDGAVAEVPERRRIGLVFQDYALFPHMSVARNIAFGMRPPSDQAVVELLELIALTSRAPAKPSELSGGEQQRVALARALAMEPQLLLLDEPFSNLDPALRAELRRQTFELVSARALTTILVTHSAKEALEVADRISVLRAGEVLQTGEPSELYRCPRCVAVARAFGAAEVLEAVVVRGGRAETPLGALEVRGLPEDEGQRGLVMIRPHDVALTSAIDVDTPRVRLERRRFMGDRVIVELEVGEQRLTMSAHGRDLPQDLSQPLGMTICDAWWLDKEERR